MNTELIKVEAKSRTVFGNKVRALRRAGIIPGNVLVKNKPSLAIEFSANQLLKLLQKVGYTQVFELIVADQKLMVLFNEVSYAPTRDIPQHVVLLAIEKGETVTTNVPLVLAGDAPGEQKGLLILQMLDQLEVTAPALAIPTQLEIDISNLEEAGDVVRVIDLQLAQDITTDIDLQTPIVRLEMPRSQVSAEAEASRQDGDTPADKESEAEAETEQTPPTGDDN